jgi:hypothetical protein
MYLDNKGINLITQLKKLQGKFKEIAIAKKA